MREKAFIVHCVHFSIYSTQTEQLSQAQGIDSAEIATDHFSGPDRASGTACVCLCVRTITWN